ncbi:MAG: glutamate formimidoyltransferase [Candidatus Coatesbacteria bacterium]|nr:MAG: glutamate formimidoyltransferase [Candidatus Coatesbacteria bacterium]
MKEIIECVPNFSEGRDKEKIDYIIGAFDGVKNLVLLDHSSDPDHNRTVVTLVGDREGLRNGIKNLFERAVEKIDLNKHKGEHPRMGAVDVVPFVPIRNIDEEGCVEFSKEIGKMVADTFNIPVYLYESSATSPERQNLAKIRKGQFEGFFEKIKQKEWKPDFGPTEVHKTAGVVAIGARPFLIAFNVNLNTSDVTIAERIAKAIRFIGGGLRYVKAMGFALEDRGITQVSMNLTNFEKTPVFRVVELIRAEARRYGVNIIGCEVVGLIPAKALYDVAEFYLGLENFSHSQILEVRLEEKMTGD